MAGTEKQTPDDGADDVQTSLVHRLRLIFSQRRATPVRFAKIESGQSLVLGRNSFHNFPLGKGISERHAEARLTDSGAVEIRRLRSANDVFIDDVPLAEAHGFVRLRDQNLVQMADSLWIYETAPADLGAGDDDVRASVAMRRMDRKLAAVAQTDRSVLIIAESGSGKERAALAVHERSKRSGPFIPIDCAALASSTLEGTLFGHKKGAYTGAHSDQAGPFEQAKGGTVFLDEIGEIPIDLQAKFLRVLQEKVVRRLGDIEDRLIDARVVAATHRPLRGMIAQGLFREDLFFRINQAQIDVPPLRDRRSDILQLMGNLWTELWRESVPDMTAEAAREWVLYEWKNNNVREMQRLIGDPGSLRDNSRPKLLTLARVRSALAPGRAMKAEATEAETVDMRPRGVNRLPRADAVGIVLQLLAQRSRVTTASVSAALAAGRRQAQRILSDMAESGLIVGAADGTYHKAQ